MESVRPTRSGWFSVLLGLSLAGLFGAIVWGFFSYRGLEDRLAEMSRAPVPGEIAVEVNQPDTLTIYYEDPTADRTFVVKSGGTNTLATLPVEFTVTAPAGERIAVAPYLHDLRIDFEGRVVTAMGVFKTTTPGTYTVGATGDVPAQARVSVGHVIDFGLLANVGGAVGLFVVSVLGVGAAIVMMAIRRSRIAPVEVERSLVGV